MPWSGGSFTRTNGVHTGSTVWVQDRAAGTKILATRHDTHDQDLADGINSTLNKEGSNAATGNLNIGSQRLTAVADGTAKTDAATVNQIQSNAPAFQATDTGTANAYVIALSPAVTAYAAGQTFTFKAGAASTGTSTLNVNTLGTKTIKKLNDQDIASGDIEAGSIVTVVYDGTNFQMTSQLASSATTSPAGSNTQVQYNNSGSFGASSNLTFSSNTLTVANELKVTGTTPTLTIGDAGAEDAKMLFDGNAQDFHIGLDDSEDDLVIGVGSTLGTPTALAIDENLQSTFGGDVIIGGTTPTLTIGDAGAEDAKIAFDGNAQDYHVGLQDSSDKLVIGLGSTLGTTTHMSFDENGAILKPLQPAFLAGVFGGTQQTNIATGSWVTVTLGTEKFDVGSNFASNTFTAPVTGKYMLTCNIPLEGLDTAADGYAFSIVTSNTTYTNWYDPGGLSTDIVYYPFSLSVVADMDASDTAYLAVYQDGGSSQTDISQKAMLSGYLAT